MSKPKEESLSVDEEIHKYRLIVADVFIQWNDERMKDSEPTSPFYGFLTIEQILAGLKSGLEVQYKNDMLDKLGGEHGVKEGLLNLYSAYVYGMNNPHDPKVSGMEKLCGDFLSYGLHASGRGPWQFS
jgi:hypothetical protein